MTSKSMPWTTNNTGDGPTAGYATDRWQDMLRTLSTLDPTLYYVAPVRLNEYAATGSSSPVAVNTGEAFVNGRHVLDDASQNVTVPTPTTSTRIDRIILRSDGTAQTVRVVRLAGVEGGAAPTLTQNSTTYEVSLWKVTITTGGVITLVDERGWLGVRGLVDATTIEWDTSGKKIRVKDSGITAAKLASDAVTTVKILDANVTTAKIAAGAVTATQLASDAVTTVKILDSNVTANKLASDAVTTVKILDGNVTNVKLASGIDGSKITSGSPSIVGLTASGNASIGGTLGVTGQVALSKAGAGNASALVLSSAQPSMAFYESDQGADKKYWDWIVEGGVLALRAVNDASSVAGNIITVTRGTGIAITGIALAADTAITGQASITKSGAGPSSGVYVTGAIPGIALNESDQVSDNRLWDMIVESKIFALRVVTDSGGSAANAITITRGSGAAISTIALGGDTTINGALTVTGAVSLPNNSIQTAEIADSQITAAKLASDAVTTVKILDANVTTAKIADGAITAVKFAAGAIDDSVAGNRIAVLTHRQGNSSTDWNSPGTNNYTPTTIREQAGAATVAISGTGAGTASITFPTNFSGSAKPNIQCTLEIVSGTAMLYSWYLSSISASGFTITIIAQTTTTANFTVHWRAIGAK